MEHMQNQALAFIADCMHAHLGKRLLDTIIRLPWLSYLLQPGQLAEGITLACGPLIAPLIEPLNAEPNNSSACLHLSMNIARQLPWWLCQSCNYALRSSP